MVVEILCGEVGRTGASAPTNLLVLEMPRLPYVKYSTGANETTRTAYRALGKPDWTAARRAFLAERTISEWHAEAKCFFRRVSAIPRPAPLFSPFFSGKTEKNGPSETHCAIPAQLKHAAGGVPRCSGTEKNGPAEQSPRHSDAEKPPRKRKKSGGKGRICTIFKNQHLTTTEKSV